MGSTCILSTELSESSSDSLIDNEVIAGNSSRRGDKGKDAIMTFLARHYDLLVVTLFFSLSVYRIDYPGIFNDEILWGNAALGGIDDSMIILKIFDVPIMLMSYIGALKSWLYYPVFKIFGVSPYSIRIPMILCGSISLLMVKWVTTQLFNSKIAAIVMVILAIDSSFVTQTRVDQGPIVLALFISLSCIYYFIKLLSEVKPAYLWAILALSIAGIFNKLNFIWFVNSFFFSALFVYGREIQSGIKLRFPRRANLVILSLFIGYLFCASYFVILSKIFNLMGTFDFAKLPERISFVFTKLFIHQVKGDSFYNYALGNLHSRASSYYCWFLLSVVVVGLVIAFIKRREIDSTVNKSSAFVAIITILLLVQIIITEQASSYWHIYVLYPFITILFGYAIFCLTDCLLADKVYRRILFSLIMTSIVGYQVHMNSLYLDFYGKPEKNIHWSSASYALLDYTLSAPYTFVSADWGIHNQLITLSGIADKYIETCYWLDRFTSYGNKYDYAATLLNNRLFQLFQNSNKRPLKTYALLTESGLEAQKKWLTDEALNPLKAYAFILHSDDFTAFRNARLNLFGQASIINVNLKLEKKIVDGNGKTIFEIYRPSRI